ncbi:MAG: S1 RNA-binding domain-containing protein, partial [Oscillospiraceae bacterium]|nr:S1 RNA-binding domain-containing protein [Candidatus Equicaccousia limihippi]
QELVELTENHPEICQNDLIVVSQTTFNRAIFEKCVKILKKVCTKAEIFDTICKATAQRQDEARALAKSNDAMVVIGSKSSSNTAKLFDICSKECKTYFVTSAAEIDRSWFKDVENVGVVAGASTPAFIIKEVIKTMSNENTEEKVLSAEITDDMSFEEALEASLSRFNTDQKVKGVVLAVNPTEIQVDIGRKQTGYVPADEYSADGNADLMKEVSVGDELDLVIMKVNDVEGTVMLSKKRFDRNANWNKIESALESGEVLNGTVKEAIKGGMIIKAFGYDIFVPASQASVRRNADLSVYVGKEVPFKIIEIRRRRNIIGSCKEMLKEQEDAASAKIWESIAVGDKYEGTVKSLTGYGAFVDIGGVDGMVHISELSWQRIKHPSEVVNVGDTIEVYVKALDTEKKKISLGYKKADENPWTIFLNNYNVGDTVNVEIVNIVTYGAFARVCTGVDGLTHISQISYDRIEKVQDVLSIGQKVDVKITDIDLDKKRVSLSIKALIDPPKKEEVAEEVVADTESGEIAPEVLAQAEETQEPAKVEEPAEAPATEEAAE